MKTVSAINGRVHKSKSSALLCSTDFVLQCLSAVDRHWNDFARGRASHFLQHVASRGLMMLP